MISGVGVDLLSKQRIFATHKRFGERFLKRIMTPVEIEFYAKDLKIEERLAKIFSGKEAIGKALGVGIGSKFGFQDVSILKDENGKPFCQMAKDFQGSIHLSFSDEGDSVISFAVWEKNES